MTAIPVTNPPRYSTFAVVPVVDYEPPTSDIPPCRQSSHVMPRRPTQRGQPLQPATPGKPPAVMISPAMRQAALFADAALRRVLEVIDRRRPANQLRPMLASGLVEPVLALRRSTAAGPGAAMLRRMRLQPAGRDAAAEVFGTYSRGERIHAIACRVERASAGAWQVVALHLG